MAKGGKASQRKVAGTPTASSPELNEAWRRLEEGDVVSARRIAASLVAGGALTKEDHASAEDLISRTQFPKFALGFAGIAAAIIVLLIVLALLRS